MLHNIGYWKRVDYLGFGIGAASLYNNTRYSNTDDLDKYIGLMLDGRDTDEDFYGDSFIYQDDIWDITEDAISVIEGKIQRLTEKDKKVVPIILKYLSKIKDENIKTHLAYFLAVKNYKEASEKLIKEFYNAKTNEYRIALSKALSAIYNKNILNELLKIVKNKEYKDVNFPIVSTLKKYKDKRVKRFFSKQI